jgi:hypothetical protein
MHSIDAHIMHPHCGGGWGFFGVYIYCASPAAWMAYFKSGFWSSVSQFRRISTSRGPLTLLQSLKGRLIDRNHNLAKFSVGPAHIDNFPPSVIRNFPFGGHERSFLRSSTPNRTIYPTLSGCGTAAPDNPQGSETLSRS